MKADCTYSHMLLLNREQKDFIIPLKNSNMLPEALPPSEHSKLHMRKNFSADLQSSFFFNTFQLL